MRELVLVTSAALLYFAVRGTTVGDEAAAVRNAHALVSWETELGVYLEPRIQGLVEHSHWLVMAMNWVYIWGHWPVIVVTLLWLVRSHPHGYRLTRNAMLLSGGLSLSVFALFPMAPPRLADLGFVDTVTEHSTSYRVLQPNALVNQYAAMPSLHVGWDLLIGIALICYGRHLLVRVAGAVLPGLMIVSVVSTGNHYLADVLVGVVLVLVCRALLARRVLRPAARPLPAAAAFANGRGRARGPRTEGAGVTVEGLVVSTGDP